MASARGRPCQRRPDRAAISQKTSIVYLGSVLSADGTMQAELGRRLGQARAEFDLLCRVWNRSSIPVNRKILVYEACVQTKLLYSLHTSWFKRDELARIDAFQARCLRKILGIQHSYVSRVSNESVLGPPSCTNLQVMYVPVLRFQLTSYALSQFETGSRLCFHSVWRVKCAILLVCLLTHGFD